MCGLLNAGKDFPSTVSIQGLITMEDVIEALIDEPILDEFDTPEGLYLFLCVSAEILFRFCAGAAAGAADRSISVRTAASRRDPKTPRADGPGVFVFVCCEPNHSFAASSRYRSRGASVASSEGKAMAHRLVYPMRFRESLDAGILDEYGYPTQGGGGGEAQQAERAGYQSEDTKSVEQEPNSMDMRRIRPSPLAEAVTATSGWSERDPRPQTTRVESAATGQHAQERGLRSVSAVDGTVYNRDRWLSQRSLVDHDYFSPHGQAAQPKNFSGLLNSIFAQGRARSQAKNVVRIPGPPATPRRTPAQAATSPRLDSETPLLREQPSESTGRAYASDSGVGGKSGYATLADRV